MHFNPPLQKATLLKRYKRFLADIVLENGDEAVAYCSNTGSMDGVQNPGSIVWVSAIDDPKRSLRYEWQLIEVNNGFVGVNTAIPNRLVKDALSKGGLGSLICSEPFVPEYRINPKTRLDFFIPSRSHYIEVKNVHMERGGYALFPDAPTSRGVKHLYDLAELSQQGMTCSMIYIVQRSDCHSFAFASFIDPLYYEAALFAQQNGVLFEALSCQVSPQSIAIHQPLPISFEKISF